MKSLASIFKRRLGVSTVLQGAVIAIFSSTLWAQEKGEETPLSLTEKIEALDMITNQTRGNLELIKSWDATYRFVDKFYFVSPLALTTDTEANAANQAEAFWVTTEGQLNFQWIAASDQAYVYYLPTDPTQDIDVRTGTKKERNKEGPIYHWILTPEHWIEFPSNLTFGQLEDFSPVATVPSTGGRIVTRHMRRLADRKTRVFHPHDLFSNGKHLVWEHCKLYLDALRGNRSEKERNHAEQNMTIKRQDTEDGVQYAMTIGIPKRGGENGYIWTTTTVFNSSVGFNPVSWTQANEEHVLAKRIIKYEEDSGIFVPRRFVFAQYGEVQPKVWDVTTSRIFLLKDSKLNAPVPASRFEIDSLGLAYGERYFDELENRLYIQDSAGLVPVEDFSVDEEKLPKVYLGSAEEDGTGRNWSLIAVNVLLVCGIVGLLLWRRGSSA